MPADRHSLDGLTLFRFAHAFEGGGGVEEHLADLNRLLSARSRITTVVMRLAWNASGLQETEERIAESRVVQVPLRAIPPSELPPAQPRRIRAADLRASLLDRALPTWDASRMGTRLLAALRRVPSRAGAPTDAGRRAEELFSRFRFDLAILHTAGGADATEVLAVARRHGVPAILVHHFANPLLGGLSVRQQATEVEWVGAATQVDLPRYLRQRFTNLSDAVDLEVFDPAGARTAVPSFDAPVLYVPARITPEKGQLEVLRSASRLGREGTRVHVVFAGRVDSQAFETELRRFAEKEAMSDRVHFLGPLSMAAYREYFRAAAAMPLLSHHVEGLPRTIMNAQAMQVPPVVYDTGGSREGLRHGETGFLVKPGDLRSAVEYLRRLVTDPELRERMGKAGRAFMRERFDPSRFAERHERLYLQVIDGFRKSRAVVAAAALSAALAEGRALQLFG